MPLPPVAQHVTSGDGTGIDVLTVGCGPPIVFVHGSLTTGREWLPVASLLADRFTGLVMNRRGRSSGHDVTPYSLDAECHDIAAVIAASGADAHIVGHSYGAVCALETARRRATGRLILYEPPLPIDGRIVGGVLTPLRRAVRSGRVDEALTIGLTQLMGIGGEQLAALRATPRWAELLALTPSAVRELEVVDALEIGTDRFAGVSAPTLLLAGTRTAPYYKSAVTALQRTLPDARTQWIEDQGHDAHLNAPAVVAAMIADFLPV
jgi:pimeloyl-ACP methyl ester carboxylesterase